MNSRGAFAWLLVAVLGLITWLLLRPFLPWLLATALLAFVLAPLQRRLEARIGARLAAVTLVTGVVLVLLTVIAVAVYLAMTHANAISEGLLGPEVYRRLSRFVESTTGLSIPVRDLVQRGIAAVRETLGGEAGAIASASIHAGIGLLLSAFLLYYLLRDGERFVAWLRAVSPLPEPVREELFTAADEMAWAVVKGHVMVAFVQGFVAGLGLIATGVPNALALTAAMMVLALIPVVGVTAVLAGATIYLLTTGQALSAAFVVVWGLTAVAVTDDYLRALLIDRESEMHPATIFVGIAGGTYLLGVMGLFVGPVLIGLFKTAVEVLGSHYGVFRGSGP